MKTIFSLFIFFSFVFTGFAQQDPGKRIVISGEITGIEENEAVPFVHIINQSTKEGIVSDAEGKFQIIMHDNDTLLFSAVGFDKYQFSLNNTPDNDKLFVKIHLNTATMELKPVEVFAYKDAESFKEAILDYELPEDQNQVRIPGSYDGPRREVKPSPLNPVSFIAYAFSKEAKEKRKLAEIQENAVSGYEIRKKYEFIEEITGLKEERLDQFLEYCQITFNMVKSSSEYDLAVVVNKCLPEFKALN